MYFLELMKTPNEDTQHQGTHARHQFTPRADVLEQLVWIKKKEERERRQNAGNKSYTLRNTKFNVDGFSFSRLLLNLNGRPAHHRSVQAMHRKS